MRAFALGNLIIDLHTVLRFPPFLGWVRFTMFVSYWACVAIGVLLYYDASALEELGQVPITLTLFIAALLCRFDADMGDKDLAARHKASKALEGGRAAAVSLSQLPEHALVHASLRDALRAFGTRYIEIVDPDKKLDDVLQRRRPALYLFVLGGAQVRGQ